MIASRTFESNSLNQFTLFINIVLGFKILFTLIPLHLHRKFVSQPFLHGELETLQGTTDNKLFDLDSLYTQLFVLPYFQSWLEPLCYNLLSPHLYIDWHRHIALPSSLRYLLSMMAFVIICQ
nr:MAG TPA: hypothetical protein [Caudoviricetes sp.]